jgi:hypothetical protein
MADWIHVKLHENGMAAYHLATKMGIATALVNAWEAGTERPKGHHIREMVLILGKYPSDRSISKRKPFTNRAFENSVK